MTSLFPAHTLSMCGSQPARNLASDYHRSLFGHRMERER
ncbi:hypothetical protein M3J09_003159 [Ascochyta lentis]